MQTTEIETNAKMCVQHRSTVSSYSTTMNNNMSTIPKIWQLLQMDLKPLKFVLRAIQ
jgi:hypothetical protein